MRAAIVLLAADGATNLAIAEQLGVTRVTVATWRKRFAAKRLDGLADEPRPGAPRKIGDEKIAEVVTTTLETIPAAATHWSTRSMAKASGLSISTVHRIWRAFSLQPHRSETFKLSADPLWLTFNAGKHAGNEPARLAQLDDGNDRAILVQGDEGPAQVVWLGHRGTPSVRCSDEVAISSPPAP